MKENKNNDQSIIDEIIESLNINESTKKNKIKGNRKKSIYKQQIKDCVKEEYEIIMDCDNSEYFVYHKKK